MKPGERKRGFNEFRKQTEHKAKIIASCDSCMYMEDSCTHTGVTAYDMVEGDNRIYCLYWQAYPVNRIRRKRGEKE